MNRHEVSRLVSTAIHIVKAVVVGGMSIQGVAARYGLADDEDLAELGEAAMDAENADI